MDCQLKTILSDTILEDKQQNTCNFSFSFCKFLYASTTWGRTMMLQACLLPGTLKVLSLTVTGEELL